MSVWTLGTDPEYLIVDAQGRPTPAHRFFPPKTEKMKLTNFNGTMTSQCFRDGYAVELNITPSTCRESMTSKVLGGLFAIQRYLEPKGYRLVSRAAWNIDLQADLKDAPEDVLTFGCDPSWNAYTGDMGTVPLDATVHPKRYAGGHLHIALPYTLVDPENKVNPQNVKDTYNWVINAETACLFIRMMDLYVGVPLTYWFDRAETYQRREFYGKAGEFRYQTYGEDPATGKPLYVGLEYRTPGPEVWNGPPVASFALGTMRHIANNFSTFRKGWDPGVEADVIRAINTGAGLKALIRDNGFTGKDTFLGVMEKYNRPFQEMRLFDQSKPEGSRAYTWGWDHMTSAFRAKGEIKPAVLA